MNLRVNSFELQQIKNVVSNKQLSSVRNEANKRRKVIHSRKVKQLPKSPKVGIIYFSVAKHVFLRM